MRRWGWERGPGGWALCMGRFSMVWLYARTSRLDATLRLVKERR